MKAKDYLSTIDSLCGRHFAPGGIYHGVEGALRFAREIGTGLADIPDGTSVVSTTYSLLIRHTFANGGVPINAKLFLAEVRWAMAHAKLPLDTIEQRETRIQKREQHMKELQAEVDKLEATIL